MVTRWLRRLDPVLRSRQQGVVVAAWSKLMELLLRLMLMTSVVLLSQYPRTDFVPLALICLISAMLAPFQHNDDGKIRLLWVELQLLIAIVHSLFPVLWHLVQPLASSAISLILWNTGEHRTNHCAPLQENPAVAATVHACCSIHMLYV